MNFVLCVLLSVCALGCGEESETGGSGGAVGFRTDARIIVLRGRSPEALFTAVLEGVNICVTGENSIRMPIRAGYQSRVRIACVPQE